MDIVHTDALGRELQVGDLVVSLNGTSGIDGLNVVMGKVARFTAKRTVVAFLSGEWVAGTPRYVATPKVQATFAHCHSNFLLILQEAEVVKSPAGEFLPILHSQLINAGAEELAL